MIAWSVADFGVCVFVTGRLSNLTLPLIVGGLYLLRGLGGLDLERAHSGALGRDGHHHPTALERERGSVDPPIDTIRLCSAEGLGPLAVNNQVLVSIQPAHADNEDEKHGQKEDESEEFWEELHEVSSPIMLILNILHIAGVIVSARLHKENLVKAMISGKKPSP